MTSTSFKKNTHSKKVELILTGIIETWPTNPEEALFLGPWCFAENENIKFADYVNYNIAKSPWNSLSEIKNASNYTNELFDRMIPCIASQLNLKLSSNYSNKYWETVISYWLIHWIGCAYDRYLRIKHIHENLTEQNYFNLFTKILSSNCSPELNSPHPFEDHTNNAILISDILKNYPNCNIELITVDLNRKHEATKKLGSNFKSIISNYLKIQIDNQLCRGKLSILSVYGMNIFDRLIIKFSCEPLFLFKQKIGFKQLPLPAINRDDELVFDARNDFENILKKLFWKYIPIICLQRSSCSNPPKVIFNTHEVLYPNTSCNIAIARENGSVIIGTQHGGGYGQFDSFPLGKTEYLLQEKFYTWGWEKEFQFKSSNFIPMPSPMLSKPSKRSPNKKNRPYLVLIGTSHPQYFYRLHSTLLPESTLDYLNCKLNFLKCLNSEIFESTFYRPYRYDYGTNEVSYIESGINKKIKLYLDKSLIKIFDKTKLVVYDHVATGFLQSFAANIPTILVFKEEHFLLHEKAREDLKKLIDLKVVFHSYEEAAIHVNSIYNNVEDWWFSEEVQNEIQIYCNKYAYSSKDWKKIWIKQIKTLLNNN